MKQIIVLFFCITLMPFSLLAEVEKQKKIIVIDASNSMWGRMDGKPKIEFAKSAGISLLENDSADQDVGILAYGQHRKSSCDHIDTIQKLGRVKKNTIEKLQQITPRGHSPLYRSLKKSIRMLDKELGEIILISDGVETCDEISPCRGAKRLKNRHPELVIHTIGFGQDVESLQCIADVTGGVYHSIYEIEGLKHTVFSTNITEDKENEDDEYMEQFGTLELKSLDKPNGVPVSASYLIYSEEGKHIASEASDQTIKKKLPIGTYQVLAVSSLITHETKVKIEDKDYLEHTFILGKTGTLKLSAKQRGKLVPALYTLYDLKGKRLISEASQQEMSRQVPIGKYRVAANYNGFEKSFLVNVQENKENQYSVKF